MQQMTTGHPARLIARFTLPILGGRLFQLLYTFTDTFIIGRTVGMHGIAAIGSTTSIVFLLLGLCQGITNGIGIVVAQRFGAEDMDGMRRSFAMGVLVSLSIGLVLSLVSVPLAYAMLTAMHTPTEIIGQAHAYIVIILGGISFTMLYNLLVGVLRAVGDSRSPLLFLILSTLVNVVLDLLFILSFGWGVGGAALATILSQALAAALCVRLIWRRYPALHLRRRDFAIRRGEIAVLLQMGLPMGLQSAIVEIGNLFV